MTSNILIMIS